MRDDRDVQKIVVGLDGSDGSTTAMRWAAHEARRHDATLTALLAWGWPDQESRDVVSELDQHHAELELRRWVTRSAAALADVDLLAIHAEAGPALIGASEWADLVVVGSRGRGSIGGMVLGSVSTTVAEHAHGPVAVIRGVGHLTGPVVVGVDGSAHAQRALRWAAAEARVRRVPLEVVHAWSGSYAGFFNLPIVVPLSHPEEVGHGIVTRALADLDLNGVVVHRRIVENTPAKAIETAAHDASVVVIGSRGRGDVTAALLGSVSRHVLRHVVTPVVVVR